jgi:hypothetical protein
MSTGYIISPDKRNSSLIGSQRKTDKKIDGQKKKPEILSLYY